MHFLPDVYVECEVCKGKRYNRETLEVIYKGKNIAEVLDMTVDEALLLFDKIPVIKTKLSVLSQEGSGTFIWASRRTRFQAARPSGSNSRRNWLKGPRGRHSISLMSPPRDFISTIS